MKTIILDDNIEYIINNNKEMSENTKYSIIMVFL